MRSRLSPAVLAVAAVLLLTGCGPSAEEEAEVAAADERACKEAMRVFDHSEAMLREGQGSPDLTRAANLADMMTNAAEMARGDVKDIIADAASALTTWAERGLPLDDGAIPLYVDGPMFILDANCSPDDEG